MFFLNKNLSWTNNVWCQPNFGSFCYEYQGAFIKKKKKIESPSRQFSFILFCLFLPQIISSVKLAFFRVFTWYYIILWSQ